MMKHLRLTRLFWAKAVAAEMEYRFNFILSTITALGNLAGGVFGIWLLFRGGDAIGGWTWDQALMVVGTFTALEGVTAAVFSPNLSRIVDHVRKGTLDYVLLKPVNSQFWLSLRNFSPWGLPNVLLGLMLMAYSGVKLDLRFVDYAAGAVPLAAGLLILYSLWFILGSTAIWFVKIYNITEVLRSLLTAGRFPIDVYSSAYRLFFTFVVPVAFLTTVPARTMIGPADPVMLMVACGMAGALFAVSWWFWRFALRYYTSASS